MIPAPPVLLKKGAWLPLTALAEGLRRREIAPGELYFDAVRKIWAPVGGHPGLHRLVLAGGGSPRAPESTGPTLLKKGAWLSLGGLVEGLRRHEIALEDFYYDAARKAWSPLNMHPLIKKQLLPIPKTLLRRVPVAREAASHGPLRVPQ
jgi:hypothetical protein